MKPIDLHLIQAKLNFDKSINHAFDLGWDAHQEHITKLLEVEQARTKLGFIQYATIQQLLGNKEELS